MLASEYYFHKFNSMHTDHPIFHGGEFVISYLFTGESRPYSTVSGIFGFVPISRPVFKGGPGAWEGVFRFTNLDLNSGTLSGGSFWRITPVVNWYLSSKIRLALSYGYGVLNRYHLKGGTHFFQGRIQLML
jgi:phosphate-selective porin OprO/OprP